MNPEDPQTIAALKSALAAQAETIALLKVAVYGLSGVVATVSAFFVAWIRTLYQGRLDDEVARIEKSDALLERVLHAIADVQAVLAILKAKAGGG